MNATGDIPHRPLGQTGETVSVVGVGGSHLGIETVDEALAIRIVRSAVDRGITFMDNSWDYNDGKSERRMGKALRDGYREQVFLMTKIDGRSKKAATKQLDESLNRLRTEQIDLVQHHEVIRFDDPHRIFSEDGANTALLEARAAGKLRFIGFTGHKDPRIHLHMLEVAKENNFTFDTVQMPLNVMDSHYRSFEQLVLPELVERGIGVIGMKPMGAGVILKSGTVRAKECLRYALSLPTSVVVTGIDSMKVLDQAVEIASTFEPLDAGERSGLLSRTKAAAAKGEFELFKTSSAFDSTADHPEWLGEESERVQSLRGD